MQVSVSGKQIQIGDALTTHAEDRLSDSVGKYFEQAIDATVVFSPDGKGKQVRAVISVHVGRNIQMQGRASGGDAYGAFDSALARIAKQLRRYKRRIRDHHRRDHAEATAIQAQKYILAVNEAEEPEQGPIEDQPAIIAEMTMPVEDLTVSEAVMRMDLADTTALVFQNKAHGGINVVYRRADGNIGWIDPQGNPAVDAAD
jgi:ribosomal subunit interface protein